MSRNNFLHLFYLNILIQPRVNVLVSQKALAVICKSIYCWYKLIPKPRVARSSCTTIELVTYLLPCIYVFICLSRCLIFKGRELRHAWLVYICICNCIYLRISESVGYTCMYTRIWKTYICLMGYVLLTSLHLVCNITVNVLGCKWMCIKETETTR